MIDYFPLHFDIKQLIEVLPPGAGMQYLLKHETGGLRIVYTDLTPTTCRDYLNKLDLPGDKNDALDFQQAQSVQVTAAGVVMNSDFLTGIKDNGKGIALISAVNATDTTATGKSLMLEVSKNGQKLCELKFFVRASSVEKFYRTLNILNSNVFKVNGWPESRFEDERWLHSDMRAVSYLFTHRLFDELVRVGRLTTMKLSIVIFGIAFVVLAAANLVMPDVELVVSVVDQTGKRVVDAECGAWFPHMYGAGATAKGDGRREKTDQNGVVIFRAQTVGSVGGGVKKEGFYKTQLEEVDFMQMRAAGRPLKAEREAVLKPIINPIPMIARLFGLHEPITVPTLNEPCGFDFEVGDWVAPRGKGKTTDIIFNVAGRYETFKDFDATLEVTFPNPGDGLVFFEGYENVGSVLRSDHQAPESGYAPELRISKRALPGQTNAQWLDESKPGSNYYFRVRTVLDEKGKVVSANYGKIYGRFELNRYPGKDVYLKAEAYYFNPTPNDRNVEFDPKRNFATDLKRTEEVILP